MIVLVKPADCLGFHRKDQYLLSPVNCWYLVLHQTRRESRDHATLNDIFMNNVIVRLSQISEDVIRLFKKVRSSFAPAGYGTAVPVRVGCGVETWDEEGRCVKVCNEPRAGLGIPDPSLKPGYGSWSQPLQQPPPQK